MGKSCVQGEHNGGFVFVESRAEADSSQYSGHLLLMISLYSMLFNDDRFDKEDSIVFDWNPIFWGFGPERFSYRRTTLQEAIVKEMERNNWMGVCCEPNLVFVVCNQFPVSIDLDEPIMRTLITTSLWRCGTTILETEPRLLTRYSKSTRTQGRRRA